MSAAQKIEQPSEIERVESLLRGEALKNEQMYSNAAPFQHFRFFHLLNSPREIRRRLSQSEESVATKDIEFQKDLVFLEKIENNMYFVIREIHVVIDVSYTTLYDPDLSGVYLKQLDSYRKIAQCKTILNVRGIQAAKQLESIKNVLEILERYKIGWCIELNPLDVGALGPEDVGTDVIVWRLPGADDINAHGHALRRWLDEAHRRDQKVILREVSADADMAALWRLGVDGYAVMPAFD